MCFQGFSAVWVSLLCFSFRAAAGVDGWVEVPHPGAGALISVAYGNGAFVAVGEKGLVLRSPDGATWTEQAAGGSADLARVKFVHDRFFAFEANSQNVGNETLVSVDGRNWSKIQNLADITYFQEAFYALAWPEGGILRSVDLQSWELRATWSQAGTPGTLDALPDKLAGRDANFDVYLSTDGVAWKNSGFSFGFADSLAASVQNGIMFTRGRTTEFVQVNPFDPFPTALPFPTVFCSSDGLHWTNTLESRYANFSRVAAGGTNYVVADRGTVFFTGDLTAGWAATNLPIENGAFTYTTDLVYGAPFFIAVADGRIFRSNPSVGALAPQIYLQPQPFFATVGGTVTLSAGAQGADPMLYQWRRNGSLIDGATNRTLVLQSVTVDLAGVYDVVVTNPGGTVTSTPAQLSVNFAEAHTYSGVTLRGSIGDKFLIESQDRLDAQAPWKLVTNVTLSATTYVWIDLESPDQPKRYYRATFQR